MAPASGSRNRARIGSDDRGARDRAERREKLRRFAVRRYDGALSRRSCEHKCEKRRRTVAQCAVFHWSRAGCEGPGLPVLGSPATSMPLRTTRWGSFEVSLSRESDLVSEPRSTTLPEREPGFWWTCSSLPRQRGASTTRRSG